MLPNFLHSLKPYFTMYSSNMEAKEVIPSLTMNNNLYILVQSLINIIKIIVIIFNI